MSRSTLSSDSPRYFSNTHYGLRALRRRNLLVDEGYSALTLRAFLTKQTLVNDGLAQFIKTVFYFSIPSSCHAYKALLTFFCFCSITLAVSSYVVAYRLFRLFKVFNSCKSTHPLQIRSDSICG